MRKGLITLLLLVLSACSQAHHDYQYFVLHPEAIASVYERCSELVPAAAEADKECVAAFQATKRVRPLLLEAATGAQAFGKQILRLQMQTPQNKLEIASRLAVMRLLASERR